jgi:hypothetical protein
MGFPDPFYLSSPASSSFADLSHHRVRLARRIPRLSWHAKASSNDFGGIKLE